MPHHLRIFQLIAKRDECLENTRAVERCNGEKVECHEREIDEEGTSKNLEYESTEHRTSLHKDQEIKSRVPHPPGGEEKQAKERNGCQDEIAAWTRESNECPVSLGRTKMSRVNRNWFCPSKSHNEEEERSEKIKVCNGIDGHPPCILCCGISQTMCTVCMGPFMHANRNENCDDVRGIEEGSH